MHRPRPTIEEKARDHALLVNISDVVNDQRLTMIYDQEHGGESKVFSNRLVVSGRGDGEGEVEVIITRRLPGWEEWLEETMRNLRGVERPEDV